MILPLFVMEQIDIDSRDGQVRRGARDAHLGG